MRLATLRNGSPDGRLVVVSDDFALIGPVPEIPTLQAALDDWPSAELTLRDAADRLARGALPASMPYLPTRLAAPLPRAWQWLDGSAFPSHAELMQRAFNLPPVESDRPLMYQGLSHQFLGGHEDVVLPSENDGIDFEAELGVITDAVPMGISAADAIAHVRLIVVINDWSLRAIAPLEMKTGFGWIQSKPACSMAPVAVTPDEFGKTWVDGRLDGKMQVWRNGEPFGDVPTTEMEFGFGELISHAARTRSLCAGTVIGSGTVSSAKYAEHGSCCISERRAIEQNESDGPTTPFLQFGETVKVRISVGRQVPFGTAEQRIVKAGS